MKAPASLVLAAAAVLAAYASERTQAGEPLARQAVAPSASPAFGRCADGSFRRLGSRSVAYAAVVRRVARAHRAPGRNVFATFGRLNVNGVPTVFGVRGARVGADCEARWYRVQLPRKPNGVTGWVRARDVAVTTVRARILVDLSARRVVLFRGGREVLTSAAAIGSSATPTPVGSYYVNQRLVPPDTNGPFGPGAIGISAFSEVLIRWAQGGPIAIHGTNRPASIGRAVSNGCIRVPKRFFAACGS